MTNWFWMRVNALATAWRCARDTYRSELGSLRYWHAKIKAERVCQHEWCIDGKVPYSGVGAPMDLYRCPKCGAFEWRKRGLTNR